MVCLNCSRNHILSGKSIILQVAQKGDFTMKYISNAFSLNMMTIDDFSLVRIKKVSASEIPADVQSVIGHPDTASVVSNILGFETPYNRVSLSLEHDDVLFVAQYKGPRLPEGATELPEGATLEFLEVSMKPEGCSGCPGVDCNLCGIISWTHGN